MYNKHSGMSAEDYYKQLGFKPENKDSSTLETHDVFAGRLAAYVYLFASIVQVGFEILDGSSFLYLIL